MKGKYATFKIYKVAPVLSFGPGSSPDRPPLQDGLSAGSPCPLRLRGPHETRSYKDVMYIVIFATFLQRWGKDSSEILGACDAPRIVRRWARSDPVGSSESAGKKKKKKQWPGVMTSIGHWSSFAQN